MENILLGFILSCAVVIFAVRRGSLSGSGGITAVIVGALTFGLGGWVWGVLLCLFFISSSALSHFKEGEKRAVAEKFEKGHRRDSGQVLANGGLGAMMALASAIWPSPVWFPLFIGVMATVTADTWATELGTLSRRPPRLITNGRVVEVGTSGGVSPLGTGVSLLGGLIVGLTAGLLTPDLGLALGAAMGAVGGLSGSLFDSLLGATAQQIYYCDQCQKETERKQHKCGQETRPLRGLAWLNNDLVNLLSSLAGAGAALALYLV
jgi:uncharacterized protein (TIGR00297 family)